METGTSYQNYIYASKNLQAFDGRTSYQASYAQDFEEIYKEASTQNIKLSTSKEFLESLSKAEISTLQKYSGLADAINIGSLSQEGAYNLLMHDYEQYDFNNDGVAEVGLARKILPIPISMPSDVRDAYITAMNSLDDRDKLMVSTLTFDINRIQSVLDNTPYTPSVIDYTYLSKRVDETLNPTNGSYSSQDFKVAVKNFWEVFETSYEGSTEVNQQEKSEQGNPQVEQFLKDLREKGASQFLADLNQEKIDAKIEDFKNKLLLKLGDSPEALVEIEKLVNNFRKQLLEELEVSLDNNEQNTIVGKQAMLQTVLDLKDNKASNLKSLLQDTL